MMLRSSWLAAVLVVGCAGPATQIVTNFRDLPEANGRPQVTAVDDLGGRDVPANGDLRPAPGDGIAVIGEALWIRGKNFGRQPTVTIGGRVAAVLSRTMDGGILVRVPPSATSGPTSLVVTQEQGQAEFDIRVLRFVGTVAPGLNAVTWAQVQGEGATALDLVTSLQAPRALEFSADGRAGYALVGTGQVAVIDMAAPGGPTVVETLDLGPLPVRALLVAPLVHRALAVRDEDVVVLDLSSPLRPIRNTPRPLPPTVCVGKPIKFALSPDGLLLAAAVTERNRVVLLRADRLQPSQAAIAGDLALLPELRAQVLVDLAFSPDGNTLWALSGSTADSQPLGPQPTQVFAVRLRREGAGDVKMELARTVTLSGTNAPVALGTGRAAPLSSGAAVRLPPERATVYVVADVDPGARSTILALGSEDQAKDLFAVDGAARITGTDVTPDGKWIVGAVMQSAGAQALAVIRADGRPGVPQTLGLGRTMGAVNARVRIQP